MKHYLTTLEESVKRRWNYESLCDFGGESFTYAYLAETIEKFRLFSVEAGISKGEKIAICARNSARWALSFWSINVNEFVAVPLLAEFHPDSIVSLVNHSESVLLYVDSDIWEKMDHSALTGLKAAINVKDFGLLWSSDQKVAKAWEDRDSLFSKAHPDGLKPEDISYTKDNFKDLAIINYTSGTTGNPKGVMLTYEAIADTDNFSNAHFPNHPGDTIVSMLPMAHMYGLMIEFVHPNVDGVPIYFLGKTPSPTTLLKAMKEVKPYMVVTVPLVMEKVYANSIKPALAKLRIPLAIPGLNRLIYNAIRKKVIEAFGGKVLCFIMGGAALNPEVERCFSKMRLPYVVGYGMTEACPLLAYEWWTDFAPGSCGKPVHEIRIDSEDPVHIPGEIQSRGPNITIGYFKNPEANEAAFTRDGWLRTGDLGTMDEKGNVFIRGRIKSMILTSSGQNIYPEEIEAVLANCPYVSESIAVDRGGKIVALVYAEIPDDIEAENRYGIPEEIRRLANKSLPSYSQIAKVELMDAPFEKTPKMSIKRYLYK